MNIYRINHFDSLGNDFITMEAETPSEAARQYISNLDAANPNSTPSYKAVVEVEDIKTGDTNTFEVNADTQVTYYVTTMRD